MFRKVFCFHCLDVDESKLLTNKILCKPFNENIFIQRYYALNIYISTIFTVIMMTVAEYAEKRGVPIQTVYSWIYRKQAERRGFKVRQIGSVKLITELRKKEAA